ncbi:MAG: energy-coupling factor ABC transporter permease [Caldimonas sp.]
MTALLANGVAALLAVGVALLLKPWRCLDRTGPPGPWFLAWALVPLLWGLDRYAAIPLLPPWSGAALLVLLTGWPLAVIAFVPIAVVTVLLGVMGWIEGLHRLVWLGVVPATFVLLIGAGLRRWLPRHLFVYIFGRGFLGTLLASLLTTTAALVLHEGPGQAGGPDLLVAQVLMGFSEAFLTGLLIASLVAFRPHWLATYTDRLYLPAD